MIRSWLGSQSEVPDLSDKYNGEDLVIEPQDKMQMENSSSEYETDKSMYSIWKQPLIVTLNIWVKYAKQWFKVVPFSF